MPYQLYDQHNQIIQHHDLQDKGVWCRSGASKEEVFVDLYGKQLDLIINPDKITNPYVPDLKNTQTGQLADLKTQNTPFFQAQSRFDYDPQYTVVFNKKDKDRYRQKYPILAIYFAIDWQAIRFEGRQRISVSPMVGVWKIPFLELDVLLEQAPFHEYQQRTNDTKGNAKGSYVLDIRNPSFLKCV